MSRLAVVPSVVETTDHVDAKWAFEFWRSTALAPFGDVWCVQPQGPFRARRLAAGTADWALTHTASSPVSLKVRPRHVDRSAPESVVIGLALDGVGYQEQADRGGRISTGGISFLSRGRPLLAGTHTDYEEIRLAVPRGTFEAWIGDADAFAGRCIAGRPANAAFEACFRTFARSAAWMTEGEAQVAVEGVLHMLRLLAQAPADRSATPLSRAALVSLARAHIERRLHDPSLGPTEIQAVLGVSRAHLYRAFAETDGIAAAIREARLTRAHHRLAAPHNDGLKIATVAYACGFADVPTFNRAFRRRFGVAPGDLRAGRG